MRTKECVRWLCVVVCLLAVVVSTVSCKKGGDGGAVGREGLPDVTLTGLDGKKIRLAELKGKIAVIEFWATWCPPCREAIPELNKVHDKYAGSDITILGISVDTGSDILPAMSSFVADHAIRYSVAIDDGDAAAAFGVSSIPALFILDRDGKIVNRHMGAAPGLAEHLMKEIDKLR